MKPIFKIMDQISTDFKTVIRCMEWTKEEPKTLAQTHQNITGRQEAIL